MQRRPGMLEGVACGLLWAALALAGVAPAAAAAQRAAPSQAPADVAPPPAATPLALQPCRLDGLAQAARCGRVRRALDPARPDGVAIDIHFALLPALSRHRAADPVFFLAGGPGQSAMALAGALAGQHGRLNRRRDLVLVDQRGTGRSAPLACADDLPATALRRPLAERLDAGRQALRLRACRTALAALPYGDLRFFTTPLAMADLDAVRAALGAERINLIGVSYGTRAALDYLRQYPARVRRAVLDGVAPADMHLPDAASADNQAALDAWLAACATTPACAAAWPDLPARWQHLLASLPRQVALPDPVNGRPQAVLLDRPALLAMVRAPLYLPALAAALPAALAEASAGRWAALAALANGVQGPGRDVQLYTGMHLSVVCSEDLDPAKSTPAAKAGADFGTTLAQRYRDACADWPRGVLPAGYAQLAPSAAPVWLLSGGLDPATPPHHAQRVLRALGAQARHTVVANAGHGVSTLPCLRTALQGFVTADDDAAALALASATDCAAALPRPPVFVPPGGAP